MLAAPYFNYRDAATGAVHQMWYDDPQSLTLKYAFAKEAGLRGVGFWHLDALNYLSTDAAVIAATKAMWDAVKTFSG